MTNMRIVIGSDHRGFHVKAKLLNLLSEWGHAVEDAGANDDQSVDYPDYASAVARQVADGSADRGILICGTGIGMAIAANKVRGVRAATCFDEVTAEYSRRHNDANVLCLSADHLSPDVTERVVKLWLNTKFEGGRHTRRIQKIDKLEDAGR